MRDEEWLKAILKSKSEIAFWSDSFDSVFNNKIDTWDYQWALSSMAQGALSITPNVNLVTNIGFGQGATHTHEVNKYANMEIKTMIYPLQHPEIILANFLADNFVANGQFKKMSITKRIYKRLTNYIIKLIST